MSSRRARSASTNAASASANRTAVVGASVARATTNAVTAKAAVRPRAVRDSEARIGGSRRSSTVRESPRRPVVAAVAMTMTPNISAYAPSPVGPSSRAATIARTKLPSARVTCPARAPTAR